MSKYFLLPLLAPVALVWAVDSVLASTISATQVAKIAKQSTVRIDGANSPGSGVIIQKNNNTYIVLTAAHVVRDRTAKYKILTADGEAKIAQNIRTFSNKVDLAVVEFTSTNKYPVPKMAKDSREAIEGSTVYVSGFPVTETIDQAIFNFTEGKVTANSSQPLKDGYSLVYTNTTLPGHSGGPVWNDQGEIVAIHGKGDVDTKFSVSAINPNIRVKTGFNLGIAVNTFAQSATALGVNGFRSEVAVAAQPTPVDDFLVSGLDKMGRGEYTESIADFDRAIQANPQRSVAYRYRGTARNLKISRQAINNPVAFNRSQQAVLDNPQLDFRVLLNNQFRSEYQLALADFERAHTLKPTDYWALEGAGDVHNGLGEYAIAIRLMNQSLRIKPTDNAYGVRGYAKLKTGDLMGALADYGAAIQLVPQSDFYYGMRAGVHADQRSYQSAIQDYTRALQLSPGNANHYVNRGLAKSRQGDVDGAIADLSQAIKLNREPALVPILYSTRGTVFNNKDDYPSAIADFTAALLGNPRDVNNLYFRAFGLAALQQYNRALDDLRLAKQIDPDFLDIYLLFGTIYLDTDRGQLAIQNLDRAMQLAIKQPNKKYIIPIALGNRGGGKYLLGDYAGALQDLDRAIAADQDLPRAFYYRGLVRAAQGQKAVAIQDLEIAARLFRKYKKTDKYNLAIAKIQELQRSPRSVTGIRGY